MWSETNRFFILFFSPFIIILHPLYQYSSYNIKLFILNRAYYCETVLCNVKKIVCNKHCVEELKEFNILFYSSVFVRI